MFRLLGTLLASFLWAGSVRTLRFLPKAYVTASTMDRAGAIYATEFIESPDLHATPGAFSNPISRCDVPRSPVSFSLSGCFRGED